MEDKIQILIYNKIPENALLELITTSLYFETMNGVSSKEYWLEKEFSTRDEFFLIFNSYLNLGSQVMKEIPHNNDWKIEFDVAYLFQLKSNCQTVVSLNALTKSHCYADALSVCRTLISRMNLLLLSSLNPKLFDAWLRDPKNEMFLDGHVRSELENNGISIVPHLYEFSSEIIHSQGQGLSDIGFFEHGLFPEIFAIENQIWVTAKFIIALSYYSLICMCVQDYTSKRIPEKLEMHIELFDSFLKNCLVPNRFDHLFTFIAEERHWEKVGKNKYSIGGFFNFEKLKEQIEKFHRKAQPKTLSKKYNI